MRIKFRYYQNKIVGDVAFIQNLYKKTFFIYWNRCLVNAPSVVR